MNNEIKIAARPYQLINEVQHYQWGEKGGNAYIADLTGIKGKKNEAYAELWIGAHPKASSSVEIDGGIYRLTDLIEKFPDEIIGQAASGKFSGRLPFLLKVLSVSEALSIQAHPNKIQAGYLHEKDPGHYPDNNHKPEIAIAIDSLRAIAGFRPYDSIIESLEKYNELTEITGTEILYDALEKADSSDEEKKEIVKGIYSLLMTESLSDNSLLKKTVLNLKEKFRNKETSELSDEEKLFLDLEKQYGADAGLLSVFILNIFELKEGEGIYIDAGIPHAYIKGNIVECMANSDNVVRAGLTPKFKDVDSLLDILTYDFTRPMVLSATGNESEKVYSVPTDEYSVTRWHYKSAETKSFKDNSAIQIILIIEGVLIVEAGGVTYNYERGQAVLIPAVTQEFSLTFNNGALIFKVTIP